jgi:ubiquinone/menaquinone biosynthesis C-methylase UbiE
MEKEPDFSTENQKPAEIPKREIFLEIGAGFLPVPAWGERRFSENETYVAADIDIKNTQASKLALGSEGGDKVMVTDARHLPFPDGSVATMFFGNILGGNKGLTMEQSERLRSEGLNSLLKKFAPKNTEEQTAILKEARRVLKEGGTLIISENNTPVPLDAMRRLLAESGFAVERQVLASDEGYLQEIKLYRPKKTLAPVREDIPYIIYAKPSF